jgi:oligoribonuclease
VKKSKKHTERILWIDLEMTGLSHRDDLILEIAAIVTDWDFNEVATYQGVVKHPEKKLMDRFATNAPFWDVNVATRDALIKQNETGKSLKKIEGDLLKFIGQHFNSDEPVLSAGNSVHVDRRFIMKNWPNFDAKLHYRMLDVSAWKVVFNRKFNKAFAKPGTHRALDDIRGSIMELKYYLTKLK